MLSNEDIYKGNNAADYQPPTQNPQAASTSLQPDTANLQPTNGQNDISQQRLPAVDGLKVIVIQDGASTTRTGLTPVQAARQTWIGPFWGCVILGLAVFVIWAVRLLAKEETPNLAEAIEEAVKEPLLADEAVIAAPSSTKTKKTNNKKTHKKKRSKKK